MSSNPSADHGLEAHGLLFIVSAPSGAGKTTLVERVVEETAHLKM
jgi:guanylate kinase